MAALITTQKAADLLGVPRQFLVRLLSERTLHFQRGRIGQRIHLRDVLAYKNRRDCGRRAALDTIADEVERAGLAEAVYIPGPSKRRKAREECR
jgi:excisionase family DNA binding protein